MSRVLLTLNVPGGLTAENKGLIQCVREVHHVDGEPRVQFAPADEWRLLPNGMAQSMGDKSPCATWLVDPASDDDNE